MKSVQIIFLFLFVSQFSFAQSYKDEIKTYREQYKNDFLDDERSPLKNKKDLEYLRFFDADETYRITTQFKKTENAEPFDIPTLNGSTKKYIEYGKINFKLKEKLYTLTLYQGIALMDNPETKDYLFLPFTDETNGEETYGAGRYMDFKIGDIKNNQLVIDFNKAYNPYCAFSDGYRCPKPPEENELSIKILAGEKKYAKNPH
jgi:uncharacterized protein